MMHDSFTTATILSVFTEEIANRGGRITESFQDGRRLFVRSRLPYIADARPKDRMEGGIGVRATEFDVWLHPYLFRQVCRNGAIMSHSIESLQLEKLELYSPEVCVKLLREAIADCAAEHVFKQSMSAARTSMETAADRMLDMLPELDHIRESGYDRFIPQMLDEFFAAGDRSQYGLMNAVTATARDVRDPEDRWRLEELGGAIGAGILPVRPSKAPGRCLSQPRTVPGA
jgi:hypothetical protein